MGAGRAACSEACGSGAEEGEGEGRREEKEKEKRKRKWERKKEKKENGKEREKREREIRAALIAASIAGSVGRARRSRGRADEATGKKGSGVMEIGRFEQSKIPEFGVQGFSRILELNDEDFKKLF